MVGGEREGPSPDEAGFREWMAAKVPGLRRKAYLMSGDWHAADDLVQDTLIAMYEGHMQDERGHSYWVNTYLLTDRSGWDHVTLVVGYTPTAVVSPAGTIADHAVIASPRVAGVTGHVTRFEEKGAAVTVESVSRRTGKPGAGSGTPSTSTPAT